MSKANQCVDCDSPLTQRPGPGRPLLRCAPCREARRYPRPNKKPGITCADCGKELRGNVQKPQGEARCVGCCRYRPTVISKQCATCEQPFTTSRSTAKYCGSKCSPWTKAMFKPLRLRGLGARHQQIRGAFAILVAQGGELCCLCSDPIKPGQAWDLDHTSDREGYRGPAHTRCNRSEGATRGNLARVL